MRVEKINYRATYVFGNGKNTCDEMSFIKSQDFFCYIYLVFLKSICV